MMLEREFVNSYLFVEKSLPLKSFAENKCGFFQKFFIRILAYSWTPNSI
jgi:hypothetical protein